MPSKETIIVGGGSAGCMLAHQLAHRSVAITLIEPAVGSAPAADQNRPAQWLNLLGSSEDWGFATNANPALAGRTLAWPRGKGLGGSSRINAMIWFPPTDDDLDALADHLETTAEALCQSLAEVERIVEPESPAWVSEASQTFLVSASHLGGQPMLYQRLNRSGRRWNPAELLSGMDAKIVAGQVDCVVFDHDRACGVRLIGGETVTADEIILCSGAIATPAILMRSGIGPADILRDCGIDVRHDEPAVGANLQDHLIMPIVYQLDPKRQFCPSAADAELWEQSGTGPVASNVAECGGLFADQTIQIHLTPTHYLTYPDPKSAAAMSIGVNVTQPKSRGRIVITSANPTAPPMIESNYFSEPSDLEATIHAVSLVRELVQQEPLASFVQRELVPGSKRVSDEAIAKSITRYAQTLYHPVGTCAGVELPPNLHVVDASMLPRLTTGNPNAAVMMLSHYLAGRFLNNGLVS